MRPPYPCIPFARDSIAAAAGAFSFDLNQQSKIY
jgi:hypothetical protein